jgi:hypothetical protein
MIKNVAARTRIKYNQVIKEDSMGTKVMAFSTSLHGC